MASSATNSLSEVSSAHSINDRGSTNDIYYLFIFLEYISHIEINISESSSDDWEKDFDIEEIPQNI